MLRPVTVTSALSANCKTVSRVMAPVAGTVTVRVAGAKLTSVKLTRAGPGGTSHR